MGFPWTQAHAGVRLRRAITPARRASVDRGRIAVSLHDVEPATFERCALIRDWLSDHGVDRVTLLVIPARDLHPLAERSPELRDWLIERRAAGDAIAQHGFRHERLGRSTLAGALSRGRAVRALEFAGMGDVETRRAVDAGWRLLKLAGLEPQGFVAPGYAYTRALRRALPRRFSWWADRLHMHRAHAAAATVRADGATGRIHSTAFGASSEDHPRRTRSPLAMRAGALLAGDTLRLEVHPDDLDRTRHMLALEWVLRRAAQQREAITYEELLCGTSARGLRDGNGGATVHALRAPPNLR
jgi:predicted deacetylase